MKTDMAYINLYGFNGVLPLDIQYRIKINKILLMIFELLGIKNFDTI